ncbi:MAG: sigma-54-dependent Fis family transcriptional regulator [Candidatus Riflebacteria bacterium]|nr:sigma-54-dependent Fis family transcriptional regulator [Candidatus Riflebacteria bacterium]
MLETEIIGRSKAILDVLAVVARVAESDVTVLITGESGTGKEIAADTIVKSSPRFGKPFIKMNCAAIPADLLESHIFGHEKGAFTGAISRQEGCFERAHSGVLFLDEIGEMALATQTKLLRVIQEREFERVGGKETLKVDVRLIAATNKNLAEEIKKNRFREDLYYRLNVVEIHLPPLRERKGDLKYLADAFLDLFAEKYRKPKSCFSSEAFSLVENYNWPGNVRELRNIIERAVVLSPGNQIKPEALPEKLRSFESNDFVFQGDEKMLTLIEMEKAYVKKVLAMTGGNKLKAAKILDIDPKTLRAKLENV